MLRIGWFSSGKDQAAIDLFEAVVENSKTGFLSVKIKYVFCDRKQGESQETDRFLKIVREKEILLIARSSCALRQMIKWRSPSVEMVREAFDAKVVSILKNRDVDIVVLAGYMLTLSPLLCGAFRCLNLHPAVPGGPKGTWRQVIWQLMESRTREAGAMMHLAIPELDAGPPVAYFKLSLRGPKFDSLWRAFKKKRRRYSLGQIKSHEGESEPLFAAIREEELRREFPLILLTLKNLAEGHFTLTPQGLFLGGKLLPKGINITEQVEAYIIK